MEAITIEALFLNWSEIRLRPRLFVFLVFGCGGVVAWWRGGAVNHRCKFNIQQSHLEPHFHYHCADTF